MSLESVFIIAAALGRTLVLPPDAPVYLLGTRGFADFFPIHSSSLLSKVPIISTDEFFQLEVEQNERFPVPLELQEKIFASTKVCDNREIGKYHIIRVFCIILAIIFLIFFTFCHGIVLK